jgi:hypothetical protein
MTPQNPNLPAAAWFDPSKQDEDCARAMYGQAGALEMINRQRRYRQALLYRLVTGDEAPALFSYWMSSRPANAVTGLGLGNYQEPAINAVASALEVFENRIGTLRPFVQVLPKGGDIDTRLACEQAEHFVDALFDECRLYDTTGLTFRDGGTWGTGWIKVQPSFDRKCLEIGRTLDDEILYDESETLTGPPGSLIQRRYMMRDDAMAYADIAPAKERDKIAAAVRSAPSAFGAAFWGSAAPIQQIALLEGWKRPGADGKPGRRCLALPNYLLDDDEWTRDHFPFARFLWTRRSLGWRGGSAAHAMLPYQIKINKWEERIDANGDRMAFSGWVVDQNTQIKAEALGGRPGRIIRKVGGGQVEPITVTSNAPDAYQELERWINRAFQRVGLSQQQTAGLKQPGITSGAALRTMVQIEDARNQALQIALEQLVKDVAELAVEAAEDINLSVNVPGVRGGRISWGDLKLAKDQRKVSVFPVSSLPNDPAGRQQQIAEWYADGVIDKRIRFKLQQMPDLKAYAMLATAEDDLIETTLNEIVKTGKFCPPEPYNDLPRALATARDRWALEKRLKTDRKVLRQLVAFMAAVSTQIESGQQFLAPPSPTASPAGAPAAPPVQATPSTAPPMAA